MKVVGKRVWRIVLAVSLTLALGWVLKTRLFPEQTETVITAAVVIGDIELTVLASGTLKPVRLVSVGAQVSGRVTSLKAVVGDQVKQGDLIAEIDSITQHNAVRTAQASLARVRAQRVQKEATLAHAEASLARYKLGLARPSHRVRTTTPPRPPSRRPAPRSQRSMRRSWRQRSPSRMPGSTLPIPASRRQSMARCWRS